MADISGNTVVGVFEQPKQAQGALAELKASGFGEEGVGVVVRHLDEADAPSPEETEMLAAEENIVKGVSAGTLTGAGLGSLWALGVAIGVLPVFGPILAGGILMTLAAGAASGALAGGLIGALVGLGIPEPDAQRYAEAFHAGRTIVTVCTETRQSEAVEILNRHGALEIGPPRPGTPETDQHGRVPHLDLRPERLLERDAPTPAGGFTSTGGFGSSALAHDSVKTFHLPGEDPEETRAGE